MKIEIALEKNIYRPNETISGNIEFSKPLMGDVKGLKVIARGEEKTEIVEDHEVPDSPAPTNDKDMDGFPDSPAPTNDKDMDGFPDSPTNPPTTQVQTNTFRESDMFFAKEIQLSSSTSPVSFSFILPSDAKNSYQGKYAWITYEVRAIADIWGPFDPAKEVVINVVSADQVPAAASNVILNQEQDEIKVIAELNKNIFLAGESISGKMTITNPKRKGLKMAEIILRGTEVANAQNVSRTTIIEEYKKNIDWKVEGATTFEMQIPKEAKRSYSGKFFRYYWEFELHIDRGFWSSNIRLNKGIEIR